MSRDRATAVDLIVEVLSNAPDLTCAEIVAAISKRHSFSVGGLRKVLGVLEADGTIIRAPGVLRPFMFRLKEDEGLPAVVRVAARKFRVPTEFKGPVLSPMDWSMRHLLGAV